MAKRKITASEPAHDRKTTDVEHRCARAFHKIAAGFLQTYFALDSLAAAIDDIFPELCRP
jgi:hypothetical protein